MRKALTKAAILFHDYLLPWHEPYKPAKRWKRIQGSVDEHVLYDFALNDQSDLFDRMRLAGLLHRPTFEAAISVPGNLRLKAAERLTAIPLLCDQESIARFLMALLARHGRSDDVLKAHILDRMASEDLLIPIKIRCAPELIAQTMELFPEPLLQEFVDGRHRALRVKASRMLDKPAEGVWRLILKSVDEAVWKDGDDQDIAWVVDTIKSPDILLFIAVFADREATRRLAADRLLCWKRLPHAEAVFAVLVEQNSDEAIMELANPAVREWLGTKEEKPDKPSSLDGSDKNTDPDATTKTESQNGVDTVYRELIRHCDSISAATNLFEHIRLKTNVIAAANDSPGFLLDAALRRLDKGKDIQGLLAKNTSQIRTLSREAAQKIELCPVCGATVTWKTRHEEKTVKVEVMDKRLSHGDVSYYPRYKTERKTVHEKMDVLYCASCDEASLSFSSAR